MRKFTLIILLSLIFNTVSAQLVLEFESDTLRIERSKDANKEIPIPVIIYKLDDMAANNRVTFREISHSNHKNLYSFSEVSRTIVAGVVSTTVPITILRDPKLSEPDTVWIGMYDHSNHPLNKNIIIIITKESKQSKTAESVSSTQHANKSDTSKWKIRIVTGSNFDFFDAPVFKNFAGDLNIFLPDLFTIKGSQESSKGFLKGDIQFGFQFGIHNFRYWDADSSHGDIINEAYFTDPTIRNPRVDVTKYIRDIYALDSKTTYNNFGIHLNPLIRLIKSDLADIYLNLHFELLLRNQILTTTKINIRKDTFVVSRNDSLSGLVFESFPAIRPLYQQINFTDFYYGAGFPVMINIKNKAEIFLTPTMGISSFGISEPRGGVRNFLSYTSNQHKAFFLGKFQFTTSIAPIDLSLGGEYRKIEDQKGFFGMYLGAGITFDKLKH